jgi:hypothetical protein
MRLSTLTCADPRCDQEVSADLAMFHIVELAKEQGWGFSEEGDDAYCPRHGPSGPEPVPKWLVGCWTCSDEWDAEDEEDAKFQASDHQCEAETYIKSPKRISDEAIERAERAAERKARLGAEQEQADEAAQAAFERQHQIESWANNWLRIRNTLVFWKKVR